MKLPPLFAGLLLWSAVLGAAAATAPGFDSTFVETRTLPGFSTPLVSHGRMSYDAARGFRWEITAPYHYVFEMRGGQARETLPDGTSRRLNPDETPWLAAVEHIFVGALSGDTSELERYFQVRVTPLAHGRRVVLIPKPGPIALAIIRIEVTERAPGEPEQLEIAETSGGHMQIRFNPAVKPAP
ncbi:MAG: LolA family protein [Gammaproteobacteria bacterium]